MRPIVLALCLAACSKTNDVTLLLGPDEDRISRGFLCKKDGTNDYLMQDVLIPGTRTLKFALVVDALELDAAGVFPGCRGEELLALCHERPCITAMRRHCVPDVEIEFPAGFNPDRPADRKTLAESFRTALGSQSLLRDLPSAPVIIRVVAMKECPAGDIDKDLALACAYSCPVQLDQVSGSVAVSLDVLDDYCGNVVRACAGFPNL